MKIDFDPQKNEANVRSRGLSFDRAADFDFAGALVWQDRRKDYPEQRLVALGWLERRLHVLCFTPIPEGIRIISFRKANRREEKVYEKACAVD